MSATFKSNDPDGDFHELYLGSDEVKLDCYLRGSITGGVGTECNHVITGPKMTDFFAHLRVKDSEELVRRLPAYQVADWRELHQVITKYQTDSFVWSDTDWSDSIELRVAIQGEARVGSILTTTATATSTEGTFPITYQWYSNDALEGSYSRIESATGPTYTLGEVDRGKFVRVVASAGDGGGFNSSSSSSNSLGPIA